MNIPFFNPKKFWNVAEIDRLREFIEDHPETADLSPILWNVCAGVFGDECKQPVTGQLDRQRLAWHLRVPFDELKKAIYPITEGATPAGWTIRDITRPRIIAMLQVLAKTGKVVWK